jgi:hypothetical protein
MKILEKIHDHRLPFEWLDLGFLPNSSGIRKEIYLKTEIDPKEYLAVLFYFLFGKFKDKLIIANRYWGDFCLDIWNPKTNECNYELDGKSEETTSYLKMLIESEIAFDYSGLCICKNWDHFLSVILSCVINHRAPFSPMFYNLKEEFVFYFHHTASIGLLYKAENETMKEILRKAEESDYLIVNE